MAIYRLIASGSFGPDEIDAMTEAYERALTYLGMVDRNNPFTELIAKAIVNVTATGERDPQCVRNSQDRHRVSGIDKDGVTEDRDRPQCVTAPDRKLVRGQARTSGTYSCCKSFSSRLLESSSISSARRQSITGARRAAKRLQRAWYERRSESAPPWNGSHSSAAA